MYLQSERCENENKKDLKNTRKRKYALINNGVAALESHSVRIISNAN